MSLRDTDQLLEAAVRETIDALPLTTADTAARKLALHYAALIDEQDEPKLRAWALRWVGPLLLDTLEALGATPAARARLKGGKTPDAAPSRLAALRSASAKTRGA